MNPLRGFPYTYILLTEITHCIYFGYMKTVINIKTDKEVKEKAQKTAKDLGFPLSTIINAYLKQFLRDKELHFSVGYHMSSNLEKLLAGVEEDVKYGKNMAGPFKTAKEMDAYLDA